jgi:hypothetical protein
MEKLVFVKGCVGSESRKCENEARWTSLPGSYLGEPGHS